MIFPGVHFWSRFRIQRSWARQWIHVCVSVRGFGGFSVRSLLPSPMRQWLRSSLTTVVWLVLPVPMHLALSLRQWHVQDCSRISRCVPFDFRQAQDLRHHDGYGPEGQWFVRKPVECPQVHFLDEFTCRVVEPVVVPQVQFWDKLLCPFRALAGFMVQTVFTLSGGAAVAALDTAVVIPVVAPGIPIDKVVDVPSHAATGSSCHSVKLRGILGPCTQVQGREPCPQGHGSHNKVLDRVAAWRDTSS